MDLCQKRPEVQKTGTEIALGLDSLLIGRDEQPPPLLFSGLSLSLDPFPTKGFFFAFVCKILQSLF